MVSSTWFSAESNLEKENKVFFSTSEASDLSKRVFICPTF